jgi:hypothetical protein
MRTLELNKQTVYYANLLSVTELTDDADDYTGEVENNYSAPVKLRISVSTKGLYRSREQGEAEEYKKVLVTTDELPITETTVFWIGRAKTLEHNYEIDSIEPSVNGTRFTLKKVAT